MPPSPDKPFIYVCISSFWLRSPTPSMRSHLKGNDNLSSYLTKRTGRAGGGRAAVGVAGARAQPRRFPARIGCASSLRAWAPRPREAGASPSPPRRQGRVRPTAAGAGLGRVPVSGSLGAWDTEAGDAAARPSLRPQIGDHLPARSRTRAWGAIQPAGLAADLDMMSCLSGVGAGARAAPAAR